MAFFVFFSLKIEEKLKYIHTYGCIFLLMRVVSLVASQSDCLRREVKAGFQNTTKNMEKCSDNSKNS